MLSQIHLVIMMKALCVVIFLFLSLETIFCLAGTTHAVKDSYKLDVTQTIEKQKKTKYKVAGQHSKLRRRRSTEINTQMNDYVQTFPDPLECGKSNHIVIRGRVVGGRGAFLGTTHDDKDSYELDVTQTMEMQKKSKYEVAGQHSKLRRRRSTEINTQINEGVVGGRGAFLGEFPWMALLGYNTRRGLEWGCGGSVISVRHVLTAAHCIYNLEHMLKVVRLGELDYNRDNDGADPIDFEIKTMIVHEEYDINTSSNDIGILILQNDVTFTRNIRPICMPKGKWSNETFENHHEYIAGWGNTKFRGVPSSHLQSVDLPVLPQNTCSESFQIYKGRILDQRVMCAGYPEGGKDSCDGDSGGPLMHLVKLNNGDKYFFQTGLISYGLQCGFYGVYTRVTHFLPWIEEKVLGRVTG